VLQLAMLQQFLRTASDGWDLALASVRALYADPEVHAHDSGGDFAGESARLGEALREVHQTLRDHFPAEIRPASEAAELAAAMTGRLDAALGVVPELAEHAGTLRATFAAVSKLDGLDVQQVHGDLHLGQVLRTTTGWVLIDFEGEPAAPVGERSALRSPLRDVAGMLRSVDYAAHQVLLGDEVPHQLEVRAAEWADRNREAFCDGYAATGVDPREQAVLLRGLELDKAVYEVGYEHANRPEWLAVPLAAIARMTTREDDHP
jgi:maltokinase